MSTSASRPHARAQKIAGLALATEKETDALGFLHRAEQKSHGSPAKCKAIASQLQEHAKEIREQRIPGTAKLIEKLREMV